MSDIDTVRALFARWERVWHRDEFDLIPDCVAPVYLRHDETGDRSVTRAEYAAELAALKQARPDVRIVVYDHLLGPDRAWFRFTMRWSERMSGVPRTLAALQSYRIEGGKLAETWVMFQPPGSAWSDAVAQQDWVTPARWP